MSEDLKPTEMDRVRASEPVDALTRIVVSKSNPNNTPYLNKHWSKAFHKKCPPVTRYKEKGFQGPDLFDYKFGRFTVIGIYTTIRTRRHWVCKCSCGNYETRKTGQIKKAKKKYAMCSECFHVYLLQNGLSEQQIEDRDTQRGHPPPRGTR